MNAAIKGPLILNLYLIKKYKLKKPMKDAFISEELMPPSSKKSVYSVVGELIISLNPIKIEFILKSVSNNHVNTPQIKIDRGKTANISKLCFLPISFSLILFICMCPPFLLI